MLDSNDEWYKVTEIVIPNTIESIGDYQFYGFNNVTSIPIPSSVTSIDSFAFSGCTSLESITFEEGSRLTNIGEDAFYNCTSLTIYCEANSRPHGWDIWWNNSYCPVVWGYKR